MCKLNHKVIVIAEAGVNHNGKLSYAKKLVDKAKHCGADYIKFQTFNPDLISTPKGDVAPYQKKILKGIKNQKKMLTSLSLNYQEFETLIKYCKKKKIKFLSSAFDIPSLLFLKKIKMDYIKIPSGEINNIPYLKVVGSFNKKILLSTGMSTLKEIKNAKNILEKNGTNSKNIIILHCVSDYPTQNKDLNLNFIKSLKKISNKVGFSDHTLGYEASLLAISLGAKFIEKHFTLSKKMSGPDHSISLDTKEFAIFIKKIRDTEQMLGKNKKIISKGEKILKSFARKSIVASRSIKKGDVFNEKNITTKRPGNGIDPTNWEKIIGLRAKKNYKENEKI